MARLSPYAVLVTFLCLTSSWVKVDAYLFTSWSEYWNSWILSKYYPTMYPFGSTYGDDKVSPGSAGNPPGGSSNGFPARINFTVPYYGRTYRDIYVGQEGVLQLSPTNPADYELMPVGITWPYDQYPNQPDPAFIAPYYAQFEMVQSDGTAAIFWRILDPRDDSTQDDAQISDQMLWTISLDVRAHTVGTETFRAKFGIVVTYANISFYGCIGGVSCPRNTLQVAVVTDEVRTYAVYNYYNLTWVGGTLQGCDPATGNASTSHPDCFGPAVGFNAGQARGFIPVNEFCYQQDAYNLQQPEYASIPGIRGRYMWEVSSYQMVRGGCTNVTSWDWTKWPMEINPSIGNMLGGDPMYISGPCFTTDNIANIQCDFNGTVVPANLVPHNITKAVCMPPVLFGKGNVTVSLSMDSGSTWKYITSYFLMQPGTMPPFVTMEDQSLWYTKDPTYLMITWDPMSIVFSWEVDIQDPSLLYVSIQLFAYLEYNENDVIVSKWWDLHTFETDYQNTGTYTFYTNAHGCQNVDQCNWGVPIPVGVMCVGRVTEPLYSPDYKGLPGPDGISIYKRIFSDITPLGWYINYGLNQTKGASWAKDLCKKFYWEERNLDWTNSTIPCPFTKEYAMVDPRFLMTTNCNHSISGCTTGSVFSYDGQYYEDCFYQVSQMQGKQNNYTGASKCCYNKDGALMYAGDSVDGSDSSKANRFGVAPYGLPMTVPALSHWVWDMSYKMLCCNWTGDDSWCLSDYMFNRPTKDAHKYFSMGSALAYGDPHFLTYDYLNYTFNGYGEYWLLYANTLWDQYNMQVQARFIQPNNQTWGETWATVIQGIAAQEGLEKTENQPIIEAVLNYPDGSARILILVDGFVQNFSAPQKSVQEYLSRDRLRKTTVICNDCHDTGAQANFTIVFQNGIAVQVNNVRNTMQVRLSLPHWPYFKMTAGLLGWWNGDPSLDLRRPDGYVINPDQSLQSLQQSFGQKWEISEAMSLFTYRMMMDYNWYRYPSFQPYYSIPPPSDSSNYTAQDLYDTCGDNFPCAYDYSVMNNYYMGVAALNAYERQAGVYNRSFMMHLCPYLHVRNSMRDPCDNAVGSHLKFTGCLPGWHLTGHDEYNCYKDNWHHDGYWWPRPNTYCMGNNELVAAILVPLIVGLLLIALIAWCCYNKGNDTTTTTSSSSTTTTSKTTSRKPAATTGVVVKSQPQISGPTPIVHSGNSNGSYMGSQKSLDNEIKYRQDPYHEDSFQRDPYSGSQDDVRQPRHTVNLSPDGRYPYGDDDIPMSSKHVSSSSSQESVPVPYTEAGNTFLTQPRNTQSKMIIRTVPASAVNMPTNTEVTGHTNDIINMMRTASNPSLNRVAYNPAAAAGGGAQFTAADSPRQGPHVRGPAPPPPRYVVYRDPTATTTTPSGHQTPTLHVPPSPDTDV